MKEKNKIIIGLFIILFLTIILLFCIINWYTRIILSDKDFCLDTGLCKEGLKVNTNYGSIEINKDNCIKYNWKWFSDKNSCNINP